MPSIGIVIGSEGNGAFLQHKHRLYGKNAPALPVADPLPAQSCKYAGREQS